MRRYDKLLLSVLFLVAASSLFGQKKSVENSKPCTNHPVNKGKYKILSAGLGGVESQLEEAGQGGQFGR